MLWTLVTLALFLPCGKLMCLPFGYRFELCITEAYSFIVAFLTVCAATFSRIFKINAVSKTLQIFIEFLTPLSFVNSFLFILACRTPFVIGNSIIYIIFSFVLSANFKSRSVIEFISIILSMLMIYPMCLFVIVAFVFGNFGEISVVERTDSPDGKYRAEVISSDQGALGGDTYIDVYKKGVNAYVFKITGKPERVYYGDWMEHVSIDIYWKDEKSLVVGEREYVFD